MSLWTFRKAGEVKKKFKITFKDKNLEPKIIEAWECDDDASVDFVKFDDYKVNRFEILSIEHSG